MRVLLDTNVLVSAFATRGLCADVLRHVIAEHEFLVGEFVLGELRPVLRKRIRLPEKSVTEIESFLRGYEVVPKPQRASDVKIRDPDDAWILATAIAGKADVIVSRDPDLQVLGKRSPVPVMSPRKY
ncbi:MAG: putative toxin-antitoxin system toxin component, PIN family [Planctomycetes bacterium]|nr:putative toxin-antitoxin system toxin component, PIN family [Planctomycetota bacterium]